MKKTNWGIIGLGNIATKFANALQAVDTGILYAVSSRDKSKSMIFGSNYGLQPDVCYDSYDHLLKDPNIDAVYIALPNNLHKAWSIKALNAKKAVLCEKPSTLNRKELDEVLSVARRNNTFYMEAMKTRFLPITHSVKKLLDEKAIGNIHLVYGDFGFKAPYDSENRLFDKALGGGSLLDVGVYPLAYTFDLFGTDYEIFESVQSIGETQVDLNTSVLLKDKDTHIHLFSSLECNTPRDYLIVGSEGSIRIPRFSNATSLILTQGDIVTETDYEHLVNGLEYQIIEVNECLQNNKLESERMSWSDSQVLISAVDKISQQ